QIHFDGGKPLFAEDDAPGETFGRLLMRRGVISNDQFVRVIDEMTRAAAGNNPLRFGEVAVSLGVLTTEQVEKGLAEQVCGVITRSLQRTESEWSFEPSPPAARPPRSFSLEISPAILAELRLSVDRSKVAAIVAARPEGLVVVVGPRPPAAAAAADEGRAASDGAAAEAHATRMAAEQAFQKGIALVREGKNASAAIELKRASDLQPDSLEYLLYATWAKACSYREIPTDSDQEALREIAQRAKRRDPLLAFASFVLGKLSMWAGDDADAKKWFYEALRLDASSDASKMVRILARRPASAAATSAPASSMASAPAIAPPPAAAPPPASAPPPPASALPSSHGAVPERGAASVRPPPVPADARVARAPKASSGPPEPKEPSGPWGLRLVMAAAVIATAMVIVTATRRPPKVALVPIVAPAATPPIDPPPSGDVDAAQAASQPPQPQSDQAQAPAAAPAVAEKAGPEAPPARVVHDDGDDMGTVVLPSRASGHRIFVDGRRVKTNEADGGEALHLRCGAHVIQIGSGGPQESIEIPCGGEVQLK
ncbi:MAG TPA: hypothetical protein VN903_00115, partial [Polyangia bacterium]|nr:hypothetical protein [Polyangia bacterium]